MIRTPSSVMGAEGCVAFPTANTQSKASVSTMRAGFMGVNETEKSAFVPARRVVISSADGYHGHGRRSSGNRRMSPDGRPPPHALPGNRLGRVRDAEGAFQSTAAIWAGISSRTRTRLTLSNSPHPPLATAKPHHVCHHTCKSLQVPGSDPSEGNESRTCAGKFSHPRQQEQPYLLRHRPQKPLQQPVPAHR
jgi:hypothetical protein